VDINEILYRPTRQPVVERSAAALVAVINR
jgi:hypothetical protein